MEHPDITHARLTGYPRPIGKPTNNSICANYSTNGDDEQMMDKIVKAVELVEELNEGEALVSLSVDSYDTSVLLYEFDDFLRESEGYHVEVIELEDPVHFYYCAIFKLHGIRFEYFLNKKEEIYLRKLLAGDDE